MIRFDMLELHNPPDSIGDCMRACVASILEIEPTELPHFARYHYDHGLTHESVILLERRLLRERYALDCLTVTAPPGPEWWLPHGLCIATGESPRFYGVYHDVVWRLDDSGGCMEFDPHPSRAGIIGRPVQYTFFIPTQPKAVSA